MSKDRSARIAEQLGMPHGTATNRLRKNILFRLLERLGENSCSVCKNRIESADDLSIEHVKPWEGRSADLFWDLDNIAFSHTKCNRPHVLHGGLFRRPKSPEGKNWCRKHKDYLPIENFAKNSARWNGLRADCRECEKEYKDSIRQS